MTATDKDALYAKWNTWLDHLDAETTNLVIQRHIYGELGPIVEANLRLQQPNHFLFWLTVWYSSAMAVAVRKLVDRRTDVVSYARLLAEIRDNPSVISRMRFRRNFVDTNYDQRLADTDFDRYIGKGREYIDSEVVQKDLDDLSAKSSAIKRFVDKRVAHHDEREFAAIPEYRELNETIEFLEVLHKKYFQIFRCLGYDSLLPPLGDWKNVFRYPWLSA